MMGSRSTLTPLKDFFACVVLRQWSEKDNPILGIQGIFHLVMGMARIFQGGGGGWRVTPRLLTRLSMHTVFTN